MLTAPADIDLQQRYTRERGPVHLSGMQALVRLPLDQNRRDRRAGLRIGTFISGYPGSPIAGYDLALKQAGPLLDEHDILHVPGANEELAATAISGTQMLDGYEHSRVDGVVAFWYGKGPGVDRSGDALKHGNFAGTSAHGAVVVLSGDDHESKSSTMPHQQDYAFVSAGMPILYPSSTREFLELGLHAVAMSRYSGCWIAMKLVNALADGGETVMLDPDEPRIAIPQLEIDGRPFRKSTDFRFFPGITTETERRLYYERHRAAVAYARANRLDEVVVSGPRDRIGIITAGKSYGDTRAALDDLGLGADALGALGVRLLRLRLVYPVDAQAIASFAEGLDEIVVIEEKRGFLEAQVKEALCNRTERVAVYGKFDERGAPLFPIEGGFDRDVIAGRLGARLRPRASTYPGIERRLGELAAIQSRHGGGVGGRTPNYCSGCPHNISTRILDGQVAWGSPGCHSFASIIEQPERHIVSMTQLGGEGLPWVGLSPYTDRPHIVQNVGDGSLFHSSYLNIRFCVAAKVNITFKILFNGYVANTGAQSAVGGKTIPELTRLLELEGVARTAVVSQHPERYRGAALAANATVHPVDAHDAVIADLARAAGVTVYIYDGVCANERRRQQKRGKAEAPNRFVVINPDVCEACGHCGALTNCMSLHRVDTPFGEKTQIHTSSCNQDYSCLGGDCPSFVMVETEPGTGYRKPAAPPLADGDLPEPGQRPALDRPYHIYIPGVGGMGVLTLNAVLAWAALLDGRRALTYDQTGAAQKWGPVLSSLVIAADERQLHTNRVGAGQADLYLACDLMAASAADHLQRCDPDRTAAAINTTLLPSGEMIRKGQSAPTDAMRQAIARHVNGERTVAVDGRRCAEALFGDYMATNMVTLGAAYQSGLVPISAASIERAIALNGVQVAQNLQAFRYGRLSVADRERVARLVEPSAASEDPAARLPGRARDAYARLLDRCQPLDVESRRLIALRIAALIDYQDVGHAEAYVDTVLATAAKEQAAGTSGDLTRAVIRQFFKVLAYKDEYEVARLHLRQSFLAGLDDLFMKPTRTSYLLHPPLLRMMGMKRKLQVGPWIRPVFRVLHALRRVRGTRLDPFGYAHVRREERRLIETYRAWVDEALAHLSPETYAAAVALASLPDRVRGYEDIKLESLSAVRHDAEALLATLRARTPDTGRRVVA